MSRESLVEALAVLANKDSLVKTCNDKLELLSQIIHKPSLHHVIDSQETDSPSISSTSWSRIATTLCEYLKNKKERGEKLKDPLKQLEPIVSLLRAVVDAADSKAPNLSSSVAIILSTLIPLLNQFVQQIWLQTACHGIFGQLLSVPAYWLHIKNLTHLNLIKVYGALLQNYPVSDMAPSNARIFKLLFSMRLPILSDGSASLSVSQASDKVSALVHSNILPLQDFLKRTGTKALQEVVEALNRLLVDAGASFAQPVLSPIMRHFNIILISRITKPNHHDFFLELVQFFRIQLRLLVSPDGSFDSGIEPEDDDETTTKSGESTHNSITSRAWISPVEKASIIGEKDLFKVVENLVSSCNSSVDVGRPLAVASSSSVSKKNHHFEYGQYALYQLYIDLLIKQSSQMASGSHISFGNADDSQSTKRSSLEDPRRRLHNLIFGSSNHSTLLASSTDPYAQYWESSSSIVLSWLQLTYVMVVEHPHFFDVSWTLKFVSDLLLLLERSSGVFHLELWMIRLLNAFSHASYLLLQQPARREEPQSVFPARATMETPPDDLTDLSQLKQLRGIWTRVWNIIIHKLTHAEPLVEEAAIATLNQLLVDNLVSASTVSSSQSVLWRLPIIVEANSWEIIPFMTTLLQNHAIFALNKNAELPQETLLNWFDTIFSRSLSALKFQPETLPEPALLVRLLQLLIGNNTISDLNKIVSDSTFQNLSILQSHQSHDFELGLKELYAARLLLPDLDPFKTTPKSADQLHFWPSISTQANRPIQACNLFSLGDVAKDKLASKLSQILAARFAQTKLDSPLQRKGDVMVPDGLKLTQQMRKQVYHGCILVELLKLLNARLTPLRSEMESQLRDLIELIESNLKMMENDHAVMTCIFQETSKLILCAQQVPSLHSLFSPLLDISISFSQSLQLSPASSNIGGSTQAQVHVHSTPPSRANSTSLSQLGVANSSLSMEEDLMDFEDEPLMTRQTTELVLSRNSTKSLSTVVFSAKLSTRLQCFFQASWMTASVYKVLDPVHRNFNIAAKALLEAISTLASSSTSNAPMLVQLLAVLTSRAEHLKAAQLEVIAEVLARFIPLETTQSEFKLLMHSTMRILEIAYASSSQDSPQSKLRSSTSSLSVSMASRTLPSIAPRIAQAILGLKRLEWNCRILLHRPILELLCLDPMEYGESSDLYDILQSRLLLFLTDADVRVRSDVSSSIASLFNIFPAHSDIYQSLYDEHLKTLMETPAHLEAVATSLKLLAVLACCSPLVLDSVLLSLHHSCNAHPVFRNYVPLILDHMASNLGYKSRISLLAPRLRFIITEWSQLSLFPSFIYRILNNGEFCKKYASDIIMGIFSPRFVRPLTEATTSSMRKRAPLAPLKLFQYDDLVRICSTTSSPLSLLQSVSTYLFALVTILEASGLEECESRAQKIEEFVSNISSSSQKVAAAKSKRKTPSKSEPAVSLQSLAQSSSSNQSSVILHMLTIFSDFQDVTTPPSATSIQETSANVIQLREKLNIKEQSQYHLNGDVDRSLFDVDVLVHSLATLAEKKYEKDSFSALVLHRHWSVLAQLLESIDARFFETNNDAEQMRALWSLRMLAHCVTLTTNSALPVFDSLFRFLHHARLNRKKDLQLAILWTVGVISDDVTRSDASAWLASKDFINAFTKFVFPLFDSNQIPSGSKPGEIKSGDSIASSCSIDPRNTEVTEQAAALLRSIFVRDGRFPCRSLCEYGTLPNIHPSFIEINAAIEAQLTHPRDGMSTLEIEFLSNFTNMSTSTSSPKVISTVEKFIEGLKKNRVAICKSLSRTDASTLSNDSQRTQFSLSQLTKSIWMLLKYATSGDSAIQRKVAEALGEIGTHLPPSQLSHLQAGLVSLDTRIPIDSEDSLDDTISQDDDLDPKTSQFYAKPRGSPQYRTAAQHIIDMMNKRQSDASWEVSRTSKSILRRLLRLKSIRTLDLTANGILCWDEDDLTIPIVTLDEDSNTSQAAPGADHWSPEGREYDAWISALCARLCEISSEEELKCCHDMCAIDSDFSEMLMPVLLHSHLAEQKDDSSFEYFLEASADVPFVVTSHKRAFRQLLLAIVAIRTAATAQLQRQLKSGSKTTNFSSFSFLHPNTAFCIAKIAKLVSMPCTALSFLELWCETTNQGELRWPEDSNAASKSRSLALEIFADLDDTDSVNGLYQMDAALHDPMSLGTIFMQERNWGSMLNLFEVAKRPSAPPVPRSLHHNVLLALQYSGHHHILQHYVAGLAETYGSSTATATQLQDLSEFQFQAAWRLSDWNASFSSFTSFAATSAPTNPPSLSAESNSTAHLSSLLGRSNPSMNAIPSLYNGGDASGLPTAAAAANQGVDNFPFHRMAFTCLRTALQTDPVLAPETIDSARLALLQTELSFVSTENRKQIGPILAKLKFFGDIQGAVEHMKLNPPKRSAQVAPSRASLLLSSSDSSSYSSSASPPSQTAIRQKIAAPSPASRTKTGSASTTFGSDSLNPGLLDLLEQWDVSMQVMGSHSAERFEETIEPLVALRGLLLPCLASIPSQQLPEIQCSYWISVLHTSRKAKCYQLASVALEHARSALRALSSLTGSAAGTTFPRLSSTTPNPSSSSSQSTSPLVTRSTASSHILSLDKTRSQRHISLSRRFALEECKFYWAQQRFNEAVALAKSQLRVLERGGSSVDLAKMLRLTGEWLGASKLESPSVVLDLYTRATDMLRDLRQDNADRCKAYFDLGKFADDLYQQAFERKSTPEWQASMALQSKIQTELGGIQDDKSRKTHATLYKEEIQAAGKEKYEEELKTHLNRAVSMYLYALLKGDKHNTQAIFRLISLWFSNSSEPRLSSTIKANIRKVAGYKFLPLFYQIASRISCQSSEFQETLQDLIVKITTEHPHPSFYQLVALANGGKTGGLHNIAPATIDKSRASTLLIGKVRSQIHAVADGMLSISQAYMDLAMHNFGKSATNPTRMPTPALINFNIPNIPVCTATYNLRQSKEGVVHVVKFDKWVKFVGGINLPRLVRCLGSDGKYYPQLVKGKDDMRQDAVMEQLFHTINVMLKTDQEARELNIRTYNVIPLSPLTGVLEWVDNTQPLGDYLLVGSNGAHVRHRPQDWTTQKCRQTMEAAQRSNHKLQAYQEVQAKFKPVLHHFFLENFTDPASWHETRMAYTRSLATSSIVGHIVGLGDRHSQNILLDKLTGELVHIDLGIAFDQGRALPVPELVPFRLTRDIVDGLGIIGVRGAFTRCCEHTVRILREKHDNLVTIAEVFLHDPLSKWLVRAPAVEPSANKQTHTRVTGKSKDDSYQQQATAEATASLFDVVDDAPRNTKATTTLIRFKQKLLGQEDGVALSVEGQVQHLITAAQDQHRLAEMFPGWAAWV